MRQPLKPNFLASVVDHQKSAALTLPEQIFKKCLELNGLSNEIRTLLHNCLPEEILNTLMVASYKDGHLVLSVQSQTAANHLRYQSNNLIKILKVQSLTFNQLNDIDVIVTYHTSINELNDQNKNKSKTNNSLGEESNSVKSHDIYGLTESTRRTISHTAQHVIKDPKLKKVLERLARN